MRQIRTDFAENSVLLSSDSFRTNGALWRHIDCSTCVQLATATLIYSYTYSVVLTVSQWTPADNSSGISPAPGSSGLGTRQDVPSKAMLLSFSLLEPYKLRDQCVAAMTAVTNVCWVCRLHLQNWHDAVVGRLDIAKFRCSLINIDISHRRCDLHHIAT